MPRPAACRQWQEAGADTAVFHTGLYAVRSWHTHDCLHYGSLPRYIDVADTPPTTQ
ncbi:hypothetical protein [Streptomyces sp. NPDC047097]|uniref:hypothetical protein n=1 Tax=Streptomyces sp. NPDC047097 TaxID=3155260 RepID=UPI003407E33E